MNLQAIGTIQSPFRQASETHIQSCTAKGVEGSVQVFPEFIPALRDLEGFERIWLLYWFDRCTTARLVVTPFLDQSEHGVFATRSPARPNPLGLSWPTIASKRRPLDRQPLRPHRLAANRQGKNQIQEHGQR
jgi:tRNA (adenine37-N6)-methyltransferase